MANELTQLYDSDVYSGKGFPSPNINPRKIGSLYVDIEKNITYICKDIAFNNNKWEYFSGQWERLIEANAVDRDGFAIRVPIRPLIMYQNRSPIPYKLSVVCTNTDGYGPTEVAIGDPDALNVANDMSYDTLGELHDNPCINIVKKYEEYKNYYLLNIYNIFTWDYNTYRQIHTYDILPGQAFYIECGSKSNVSTTNNKWPDIKNQYYNDQCRNFLIALNINISTFGLGNITIDRVKEFNKEAYRRYLYVLRNDYDDSGVGETNQNVVFSAMDKC